MIHSGLCQLGVRAPHNHSHAGALTAAPRDAPACLGALGCGVGLVAPMLAPGALWSLLAGKAPGWRAAAGGFWLALAASEECLALAGGGKALPVSQARLAGSGAKSKVKGMTLDPFREYCLDGEATHNTSVVGSTTAWEQPLVLV